MPKRLFGRFSFICKPIGWNKQYIVFNTSLILLYLLFCCCCNRFSFASSVARSMQAHGKSPHGPHECGSIDIRNECSNLRMLRNCTVVKGFLRIVLMSQDDSKPCEYEKITFPYLREITDYFVMYRVKGLKNIREMFPNLTVIRGRRLILNYAFGVTEMFDLEYIEFKSLVAIQRGHVFIGNSPKLCQLDKVNWDRLTLADGQNHIFPSEQANCSKIDACHGCPMPYCWSQFVCQRLNKDNIINYRQNTDHCHELCLGGCYNSTDAGCAVCKGLTDHGVCVDECPPNKFEDEHTQRCYTRDECVNEMRLLAYNGQCVTHCPVSFIPKNGTCESCDSKSTCVVVCQPDLNDEANVIEIRSLSEVDNYAHCQVINGSLIIYIRSEVNEKDLEIKLGGIREIKGYLKVYRSPHLTSLSFFKNLQKIYGNPSESGHYSIIIYDNKSLKELWKPPDRFELVHGGMFIHLNNRLCNQLIMEFGERVNRDKNEDSIQTSDQETLCGPEKLKLDVQVLSHTKLLFSWQKEQTADQIEVMHRPLADDEKYNDESELDTPVCERIIWHRQLIFKSDLNDNGTHYSYEVDGLVQNTRYACLVKTFGLNYVHNARSDLVDIRTKKDIPLPPVIEVIKKTDSSITFTLKAPNTPSSEYSIDYYLLEVYKKPDDVHFVDKRNYCLYPAFLRKNLLTEVYSNSAYAEDYDDCCARVEDDNEDERFTMNMRYEFSCSLDKKENCAMEDTNAMTDEPEKPIFNLSLHFNSSLVQTFTQEIHHLERYSLYLLMAKACNEIGCSSAAMHSERTNFTTSGDLVSELYACHRAPHIRNGPNEYRVYFSEPKQPNAVIVSYMVHFMDYIPNAEHYRSHIGCVTRLEHEKSKFVFVRFLNSTFNQVAVRAHSLAGDVITHWFNITECDSSNSVSILQNMFGLERKRSTAMTANSGHSVNTFLVFFLFGCMGTILWVCYKQRYWRRMYAFRNFVPTSFNATRDAMRSWVHLNDGACAEDRQILVDNFETVRFHNRHDDDEEDDNDTTYSSLNDQ